MITFTSTQVAKEPAPKEVLFSPPQPPARRRYLPYILLAVAVFALGNIGTWLALKALAPEVTEVAVALPEDEPFEVDQFEEAVTRALTSQVHYETLQAETQLVVAPQVNCTQALADLAALGAAAGDTADRDILLLDLARSIAREAVGCSVASITVQGHSAHSEDEVENLRASWQQAESTIARLADEGLDVSLFRPLGFGSRALEGGNVLPAQNLSFHISFNS